MRKNLISISADWDDEAQVWVASSDDLPGLNTEAATIETLRDRVFAIASDLADLHSSEVKQIGRRFMARYSRTFATLAK